MADVFGSIPAFGAALVTVTIAVGGFDLVFAVLARVVRSAPGGGSDD